MKVGYFLQAQWPPKKAALNKVLDFDEKKNL